MSKRIGLYLREISSTQITSTSISMALALLVLMLAPAEAFAAPWDSTANQVLAIFSGALMRTIATIAVIASGVAAWFGRLSWDLTIKIVVGIVLVFGAPTIVSYFSSAAQG